MNKCAQCEKRTNKTVNGNVSLCTHHYNVHVHSEAKKALCIYNAAVRRVIKLRDKFPSKEFTSAQQVFEIYNLKTLNTLADKVWDECKNFISNCEKNAFPRKVSPKDFKEAYKILKKELKVEILRLNLKSKNKQK